MNYESWYYEHVRSFEVIALEDLSVLHVSQLNDTEMAAENIILHVHTPDTVRKMILTARPQSVDEFKKLIKEKCRLDFDFSLSYEDPDFNGQLCSLLDIEELPKKAVVKVVRFESDVSSIASDDTIILSCTSTPERTQGWPREFGVPMFSYEVELILAQGNSAYEKTGRPVILTKGQKHNILETLAEKMHSFKAYPSENDMASVAEALVTKHPCLKEQGSKTGCGGWLNSLIWKMGNYRTKLSKRGVSELVVNTGKRSKNNPNKESPHTNIKKPKRAEVNFLPNFPQGEDSTTLEEIRIQMGNETKKMEKNLLQISQMMQTTFALRRKEVVTGSLSVNEILERWPAFNIESQVCAEFHRITNVNLKNKFYSAFDQQTRRLLTLLREKAARSGQTSQVLSQLFNIYDRQEEVDIHTKRALILRCLPAYLHEDDSTFLKTWEERASDEPDIDSVPVGLLAINSIETFCSERIAVVLEGDIILNVASLADGYVILFGLMYALHLSYPKQLANTFDFIQQVVMGLEEGKLRPKVLSLKNRLCLIE